MVIDARGGFPGYLALWPTLAAAAVMVAGRHAPTNLATRLLSARWLVWMAGISYALYLVHWPVLVTYLTVTDSLHADALTGAVLIVLSLLLAAVFTYGVERPVHRLLRGGRASLRQAGAIIATLVMVGVPVGMWQAIAQTADSVRNPGAGVLLNPSVTVRAGAALEPQATLLADEWVALDGECRGERRPISDLLSSACSIRTASSEPAARVLVVGDSHAQQWMGALVPIAEQRDWEIVALLRGGCSFAADEPPAPGADDCTPWRNAAMRFARGYSPDFVMLMGTKSEVEGPGEWVPAGLDETIRELRAIGSDVVLVRDNPRFAEDMFQCVEEHGADARECTRPRRNVQASRNPAIGLEQDGVAVVDLTDLLCPDAVCEAVVGGVVIYLDDNHLTQTYARTMAPAFAAQISGIAGIP